MQLADLDINKLYTSADYFKWKFDERVELIKGKLLPMSPAPNQYHQRLAGEIHFCLKSFLHKTPCSVFFAPFDVPLPRKANKDEDIITVLQPDLCVICDKAKLADPRGCLGAPDIVVEILSPLNSTKELKHKYEVYEESGVKEYWVVMPAERTMLTYTLTDGRFVASRLMVAGDIVTSSVLPGFAMDLKEIFGEEEEG